MKQKIKMVNKIFWVFPAVGMVIAAVAYPFLPQQLVTRWDSSGQPDQTMHKAFLFVIPLVLAFCVFVFTWLPTRASKGKNSARFWEKENPILQVLFFLILLGARNRYHCVWVRRFRQYKGDRIVGSGRMFRDPGEFFAKIKACRIFRHPHFCNPEKSSILDKSLPGRREGFYG